MFLELQQRGRQKHKNGRLADARVLFSEAVTNANGDGEAEIDILIQLAVVEREMCLLMESHNTLTRAMEKFQRIKRRTDKNTLQREYELVTNLALVESDLAETTQDINHFNEHIRSAFKNLERCQEVVLRALKHYSWQKQYLQLKVNICSVLLVEASCDSQMPNKYLHECILSQFKCAVRCFQACDQDSGVIDALIHRCYYYAGVSSEAVGQMREAEEYLRRDMEFKGQNEEDRRKTRDQLMKFFLRQDNTDAARIVSAPDSICSVNYKLYVEMKTRFSRESRTILRDYSYYEELLEQPVIEDFQAKLEFVSGLLTDDPRLLALFRYTKAECLMRLEHYTQALKVLGEDIDKMPSFDRVECGILRICILQRMEEKELLKAEYDSLLRQARRVGNMEQVKHIQRLQSRYILWRSRQNGRFMSISENETAYLNGRDYDKGKDVPNEKPMKLDKPVKPEKSMSKAEAYLSHCREKCIPIRELVKECLERGCSLDLDEFLNLPENELIFLLSYGSSTLHLVNHRITDSILSSLIAAPYLSSVESMSMHCITPYQKSLFLRFTSLLVNISSVKLSYFPLCVTPSVLLSLVTSLRCLSLPDCHLTDDHICLLERFLELVYLDVSQNQLVCYSAFNRVQSVDLSGNRLEMMEGSALREITCLMVRNIDFNRWRGGSLRYVREIDVSGSSGVEILLRDITRQAIQQEAGTVLEKVAMRQVSIHQEAARLITFMVKLTPSIKSLDMRGCVFQGNAYEICRAINTQVLLGDPRTSLYTFDLL